MKPGLGLDPRRGVDPGRRTTDAVGLDELPWPVKAIAIIGGTTCIACFLVWFLAVSVTSALTDLKGDMKPLQNHIDTSKKLGDTLEQLERDHRDSNIRIEGYMRLMCVQSAKTKQDQHDCLSVR